MPRLPPAAKSKADYIMTEVAALIKGGETGAAIVPGSRPKAIFSNSS